MAYVCALHAHCGHCPVHGLAVGPTHVHAGQPLPKKPCRIIEQHKGSTGVDKLQKKLHGRQVSMARGPAAKKNPGGGKEMQASGGKAVKRPLRSAMVVRDLEIADSDDEDEQRQDAFESKKDRVSLRVRAAAAVAVVAKPCALLPLLLL